MRKSAHFRTKRSFSSDKWWGNAFIYSYFCKDCQGTEGKSGWKFFYLAFSYEKCEPIIYAGTLFMFCVCVYFCTGFHRGSKSPCSNTAMNRWGFQTDKGVDSSVGEKIKGDWYRICRHPSSWWVKREAKERPRGDFVKLGERSGLSISGAITLKTTPIP